MSNIAEGAGRNSDRDFAHFLEQAYGSLMETACQLFVAFDEGYLNQEKLDRFLGEADSIAGQLVCLNRALEVPGSKVRPRASQ